VGRDGAQFSRKFVARREDYFGWRSAGVDAASSVQFAEHGLLVTAVSEAWPTAARGVAQRRRGGADSSLCTGADVVDGDDGVGAVARRGGRTVLHRHDVLEVPIGCWVLRSLAADATARADEPGAGGGGGGDTAVRPDERVERPLHPDIHRCARGDRTAAMAQMLGPLRRDGRC
jgi:hypothetical protein